MRYKNFAISLGYISALTLICIGIGSAIAYFSKLGWPSASLFVFASLLLLGQWIDDDGRSPGGLEYDPIESRGTKRLYRVSAAVRYFLVALAVAAGVWLAWPTSTSGP